MNFRLLILIAVFFGISSITIAQEVPTSTSNVTQHIMSTAILEIEGMACQEGCADKISSNLI